MSPLKTLMLAIAVSAAGIISTSVAAPAAEAQGTKVVIVDQQKVISESMGLKDINTKIKNIGEQINTELAPEDSALQSEGQSLNARVAGRTQEQLQADAAFVAARTAFARKSSAFQEKALIRQAELNATQQTAQAELGQAFNVALQEVLTETGADIVLDIGVTAAFQNSVDVTDQVLAKLNQQMPTVTVSRKSFTEEEKQQVLAAVAQQQSQQAVQLARQGAAQQRALNAVVAAQRQAQAGQQ